MQRTTCCGGSAGRMVPSDSVRSIPSEIFSAEAEKWIAEQCAGNVMRKHALYLVELNSLSAS